jgi:hypothetical protein
MIDPNSGSEADSFEVYCNFDSESDIQTCVYPVNASAGIADHLNGESWYSDSESEISYLENAYDQSQLNFLKVNYRYATQSVTFDCNDSRSEFILKSGDDHEFNLVSRDVNIISNTCDNNGELELEVTSKSKNMPVTDFSSDSESFGFDMKPVCFYG